MLPGEWNGLKSTGIDNIVAKSSGEEQIITSVENLIYKTPLRFPRIKILVVEDDNYIRDAIKICFRIYWPEAQIQMVPTGQEGINMAQQTAFDLILLDLGLPDMSGFDVLNHIRTYSQVPVIILTANRDGEHVVRAIQSGATEYLVKPFKQRELMPRIRKAIEQMAVNK